MCRAGPHRFNGGVRTFSARGVAALLLGLGMSAVAQASPPMTELKAVAAGTWWTLAAASGVALDSTVNARQGGRVVCDALRGDVEYQPLPRMGPDFSGSALEMFRVEGKPEVRYASRPASLQGAPEGTTIQHAYALDEDGSFELTVCFHSEAGPGFQAHSGPIRSSGGEHAVVSQVFVADADGDTVPELVMLVSWVVSNALGTSGRLYEPVAFGFPEEAGMVPDIPLDGRGLESGLDGVMEGEAVEYPFKSGESLRACLAQPDDRERARKQVEQLATSEAVVFDQNFDAALDLVAERMGLHDSFPGEQKWNTPEGCQWALDTVLR